MMYPWSVLSRSTIAQPVTPALGDSYLIPPAATGTAWGGKDGQVGIYTQAGWRFAVIPVGRELYIQDQDAKYYRNASGVWVAGIGSITLGAGSVPFNAVLGTNASFMLKVENQTTNTPPGSPVTPTAYIIGPSPTGAWAGNAGKLAICLAAGVFTIISPVDGDLVYDKSLRANYTFSAAANAWVSSTGAWVAIDPPVLTTGLISSLTGTTTTAFPSDTAPPTTGAFAVRDPVGVTHTAKHSGALLRISYRARVNAWGNSSTGRTDYFPDQSAVLALFRDGGTNAIDWMQVNLAYGAGVFEDPGKIDEQFLVTAIDALPHTYSVAVIAGIIDIGGAGIDLYRYCSLARRRIMLEESI